MKTGVDWFPPCEAEARFCCCCETILAIGMIVVDCKFAALPDKLRWILAESRDVFDVETMVLIGIFPPRGAICSGTTVVCPPGKF